MTDEIKDKLAKVEAKSKSKTEQIASLVRMIFTQKRERVVFSKEERETIYDKVLASVEFTDEEKKRYQECRNFCEEYRKRKAIKKLWGFCIIPWIKMLNYPSISTKLS